MNLRNGKIKQDYIDLDDYTSPVKRSPYNTRYQLVKIKTEPTTYYEAEVGPENQPIFFGRDPRVRRTSTFTKWVDYKPEFGSCIDTKPKIEPMDIESSAVDTETIQNQVKKIKTEVIEDEFMDYYRDQLSRQRRARPISKRSNRRLNPISLNRNGKSYICYLCGKQFPHFCRLKVIFNIFFFFIWKRRNNFNEYNFVCLLISPICQHTRVANHIAVTIV